MRRRRAAVTLAIATAAVSLITTAPAQDLVVQPIPPGIGARAAANPADPNDPNKQQQSVYVRDSAAAADQMALAARMERLKEWNKAADIYQEIIDKFPDRVVPSRTTEKGEPLQYTTVALAVQDKLCKWPAEGLDAYKARFEPVAAALVDQAKPGAAGDLATLSKVVSQYFVTDAAKAAAIRLMDLQSEAGEFAAAAWLGQRLADAHPALAADRPMVLFRTALAYHLAGDTTKAQQFAATLKQESPDAVGTVAGKDTNLATALAADLAQPPPAARAETASTASDSWPTFAGENDRSRVSTAKGSASARMKGIALSKPPRGAVRPGMANVRSRDEDSADRALGRMLGVMPVVDRGELFFHDSNRLYAVSIESGFPLPGWLQTYPGDKNGAYATSPPAQPTPRDQQLTCTVTDSAVLAVMGLPDRLVMSAGNFAVIPGNPQGLPGTRLECLDRTTGAKRWTANPRLFEGQFAELKSLEFSGCPAVVGDNVYVAARGTKGNQFEDAYLLCLDLATGKPRWAAYLASANSPANPWMDVSALPAEPASHVAVAGGRVYVATNIGALACVDAFAGSILWLNLYPRDVAEFGNDMVARLRFRARTDLVNNPGRPWTYNPPVVDRNRVFLLPADAKHLLIYDAGTGQELKRVEMADLAKNDEQPPDTLLSADGDRVIVAGNTRLFCLDWAKYDPATFDLADLTNAALVWPRDLPGPIRGRGFVTADHVYVPTDERLYQVNVRTGKVDATVPAYNRTWEPNQGRGNVLVAADHVVIAGSTEVEIRTDLNMARARLDKLVAADPNRPGPRLVYAETMFNAGQPELALQQLDEAARLIGRAPAAVTDRAHLFALCMSFAQSLINDPATARASGPATNPASPAPLVLADQVFDRAATAAATPQQMVQYRLQRARLARARKDAPAEVRLLQEILTSDVLRPVPVVDEDTSASTLAAVIAKREIDELIKTAGPECYAPYEAEATRALAAAGPEPAVLLSIANAYPNSTAAPKALLAAADFYEATADARPAPGNPRAAAVQTLRQLYFKYPDAAERPRVLEALARNYLLLPGKEDVALARLAYAARQFPDRTLAKPLKLPSGRTVENASYADAAAAVREAVNTKAAAALPDFRLPSKADWDAYRKNPPPGGKKTLDPYLPESPGSEIKGVAAIIAPAPQYARHDRVLAFLPGKGLACIPVGSAQPLWTCRDIKAAPRGAAWAGNDVIAWDASTLYAVGAVAGAQASWTLDLRTLPMPEAIAGPTDPAATDAAPEQPAEAELRRLQQMQNRVIIQGQRPIIIRNGVVMQQLRLAQRAGAAGVAGGPEQITDVKVTADRILVATSAGRVVAVAPAGTVAWQQRLGAAPLDCFAATDEFVAAKSADPAGITVAALDTFTGQVVYRKSVPTDGSTGAERIPINLALAPDGTLVFTTFDRLCGKDLYDPSPGLSFETPALAEGAPVFTATTGPDQLIVAGPRIVAVSDNGAFVRIHNLADGRIVKFYSPDVQREVDALLNIKATDANVRLRVAGSRLYAFGPRSLHAYDLDHPDSHWTPPYLRSAIQFKEAHVGQDYLVMVDDPGNGAPRVHAFSRFTVRNEKTGAQQESGVWVFDHALTSPHGIRQAVPVTGGLYYVANNDTLHYLPGARK